ncbi:MAG: hypothetical protein L3J43_09650 [Sulfurovum sp.]|nr:hypothetical protein [Sulfurovum sp.]
MENENKEKIIIIERQSNLGIASVIFGLVSIFVFSVIFVPLALLFGILGLVRKQYAWSIVGIIFAIIGFATSPMLLGMVGVASMGAQ